MSKTVFMPSLMKVGNILSITLLFMFDSRDSSTDGHKQFSKRFSSYSQ